jgi:hypothetical protein
VLFKIDPIAVEKRDAEKRNKARNKSLAARRILSRKKLNERPALPFARTEVLFHRNGSASANGQGQRAISRLPAETDLSFVKLGPDRCALGKRNRDGPFVSAEFRRKPAHEVDHHCSAAIGKFHVHPIGTGLGCHHKELSPTNEM